MWGNREAVTYMMGMLIRNNCKWCLGEDVKNYIKKAQDQGLINEDDLGLVIDKKQLL